MADAQKKIDLDPTFLSEETERGKTFWNKTLVEMKFSVEKEWIAEVRKLPEQKKPNYGMGNMDPVLEELTGNKLELVGPMLDSYLREIGQSMCNKLTRSKATGLMSPISLFIPYAMFKHLWVLAIRYHGDMSVDNKANITDIPAQNCNINLVCSKVFRPKLYVQTTVRQCTGGREKEVCF